MMWLTLLQNNHLLPVNVKKSKKLIWLVIILVVKGMLVIQMLGFILMNWNQTNDRQGAMKINCIKTSIGFVPCGEIEAEKASKFGDGEIVTIDIKTEKRQRTKLQNRSLHSYLGQMSKKLNAAGYDFKQVVKLPVSFTTENMKEYMFHPVMTKMYPDIESTKDLTTVQLQSVYEAFNGALAIRFEVSGDWPNRFNGGIA